MRVLGIGLSALATFVVVFLLAAWVHFPGEAARDRLSWELQEATDGAWLLQAADARPWRLGLALEDVVLFKRETKRRRATEEEPTPALPVLRLEELAVRARLLPLLRGDRSAAFAMDVYGGELDGDVSVNDTRRRLRVEGGGIDLSRIPLEGDEWSIEATGLLGVEGDLSLGVEDVKTSTGLLRIEVTDLVFQQATIMGMTLEPTPFSEAVLAFDVKDGKAEVTQGRFSSEPVDITVKGEISLNKALERSRLKLELEVRFSEQFDTLARMAPDLKAARDEDGVYHFKVSGTLSSPRLREDRLVSRNRTLSPSRLGGAAAGDDEGDAGSADESEEDAEERRAKRRERIAERRQRMLDRRENKEGFDEPGLPPLPGELRELQEGGDAPRALDRRPFGDREEVVDVELGEQGGDPAFDEEPLPGDEELPPDEGPIDEEPY